MWTTKKDKNNKINAILESFLLKKVHIENIHFFPNSNIFENDPENEKVFINSH
jgi:hypothetical protein